jgi:hypothetical protein
LAVQQHLDIGAMIGEAVWSAMSRTTLRGDLAIISRLTTAWSPYLLNSGAWPRPSPAMTILFVVQSVSQPSRVFTRLSSAIPSLMSFSMKASRIVRNLVADLVGMAFRDGSW